MLTKSLKYNLEYPKLYMYFTCGQNYKTKPICEQMYTLINNVHPLSVKRFPSNQPTKHNREQLCMVPGVTDHRLPCSRFVNVRSPTQLAQHSTELVRLFIKEVTIWICCKCGVSGLLILMSPQIYFGVEHV